ncbi:MAG: hydroxymethylbilane synthase [Archaeoglobaceae archaeon]
MSEKIVVGSRGSKLALAQTKKVLDRLVAEGYEVQLKIIKTEGDIMKDKPLHEFKGRGAFVRAIDQALAKGEIDVAVHSYKDVPTARVEGTVIAAVLERDSPCDVLISRDGRRFEELPNGALIGTSSLRRRAQLLRLKKDLRFGILRGNLDTRIRKLKEGFYDAIVVAEAGIQRLGIDIRYHRFSPEILVPAANQGIIAVATRKGEEELVNFMNDEKTWIEAEVERAVVRELGIGCAIAAGVYAEVLGDSVRLICEIFGDRYVRVDEKLSKSLAIKEAEEVARRIKVCLWGKST